MTLDIANDNANNSTYKFEDSQKYIINYTRSMTSSKVSLDQEISTTIHLPIRNVTTETLDNQIVRQLKTNEEGVCGKYGYVIPNTIQLCERSMPRITTTDNQSVIECHVRYSFESIYPCEGDEYECVIQNTTKSGMIGYLPTKDTESMDHEEALGKSPILFILPHDLSPGLNDSQKRRGTKVKVTVLDSRIQYHSKQMRAVAKYSV